MTKVLRRRTVSSASRRPPSRSPAPSAAGSDATYVASRAPSEGRRAVQPSAVSVTRCAKKRPAPLPARALASALLKLMDSVTSSHTSAAHSPENGPLTAFAETIVAVTSTAAAVESPARLLLRFASNGHIALETIARTESRSERDTRFELAHPACGGVKVAWPHGSNQWTRGRAARLTSQGQGPVVPPRSGGARGAVARRTGPCPETVIRLDRANVPAPLPHSSPWRRSASCRPPAPTIHR